MGRRYKKKHLAPASLQCSRGPLPLTLVSARPQHNQRHGRHRANLGDVPRLEGVQSQSRGTAMKPNTRSLPVLHRSPAVPGAPDASRPSPPHTGSAITLTPERGYNIMYACSDLALVLLQARPLLTKCMTSLTGFAIGDTLAQVRSPSSTHMHVRAALHVCSSLPQTPRLRLCRTPSSFIVFH